MKTKIILSIFFSVWIALLVRVYYISIKSNEHYDELANKNTIKKDLITPIRGDILDRNGEPIAINKIGFKVMCKPHLSRKNRLPQLESEIDAVVANLPKLSREKLIKEYIKRDSYYNHNYISLVDFIPYNDIMPVYSRLNLRKNLRIEIAQKRFYPNSDMAAHLIGYISKANLEESRKNSVAKLTGNIGKSGVEYYYNDYLQGEPGYRLIKVSAYNEEIEELEYNAPDDKHTLTLGIDLRVQKFLKKLFKDRAGAAIVMDVNGTILAAGSYPEYDLNSFVSGISRAKWSKLINNVYAPFSNKIISGLYPPGSTIKPGLGLIFLNSSQINRKSKTFCISNFKIGDRKFRCWKKNGHHSTDLNKAIRESCDDYFYKGSLKVGNEAMAKGFKRFGFGEKSGIDLPNEFIGTVPSRSWKRQKYNRPWVHGETLNTSIGQGDFLVTPIQIARYTALLATGKLPRPHVAYKKGDTIIEPELKEVFSDDEKRNIKYIRSAMEEVANHKKGTASWFVRKSRVRMAGKTGTSQVVGISQQTKKRLKEHEMERFKRSHAWLTTYAPTKNPQYVITAIEEHGGHGGSAVGGDIAKIYNKLHELGYISR